MTYGKWLAPACSLGCFLVACLLTVGHIEGGFFEDGFNPFGFEALLFGGLWSLFAVIYFPCWFANPMVGLALWKFGEGKFRTSTVLSGIAAVLSLELLAVQVLQGGWPEFRAEPRLALRFFEGRIELYSGYFLWVTSLWIFFAGRLTVAFQMRTRELACQDPPWLDAHPIEDDRAMIRLTSDKLPT